MTRSMSPGASKVPLRGYAPTILLIVLAMAAGLLSAGLAFVIPSPVYVAVGAMALAGGYFVLLHVESALPLLVFVIYIRLSDVLQQSYGLPSTAKFIIGLFLGMIAFRWFITRKEPTGWQMPLTLVGAYGLVMALSTLYAGDQERTLDALDEFIRNALVIIIFAVLLQRLRQFRHIVWAMLAAGVFLGTLSVIQQVTGTFDNIYGGFALGSVQHIIGDLNEHRIAGPIGDPNFYAQILVALVPFALERLWNSRSWLLRVAAFWALVACGLAIVFTFSRGAFIAVAVVIAIMFVRRPPRLPLMIAAIVGVVLLVRFVPDQYIERLQTIPDAVLNFDSGTTSEVSFRGRISEMTVALNMFADNPILGVGVNNYPAQYLDYSRSLGLDSRREQRPPHNLFLEIAAESGILGLIVFGSVCVIIFQRLIGAENLLSAAGKRDDASLLWALRLSLIGYFICGIFLHAAFPRYMWLLLGLAMVMPQVAQNELGNRRRNGE